MTAGFRLGLVRLGETQMADELNDYVAEAMKDPEFARVYERERMKSERFIRRRRFLCHFGVHLQSLSDGLDTHCACGRRTGRL
jgi:hypothetical protein